MTRSDPDPITPAPVHLPHEQRRSQPWANGQGLTAEVTRDTPEIPGDEPRWRINIAEIPGDCEFSEMVGIERQFLLLDDVPLTLDLDGICPVGPMEVVRFAGEMAPACAAAGPARALNLLLRRGQSDGTLEVLEVEGRVTLAVPPGGCLVLIKLDGEVTWPGAADLQVTDALRQDRPTDSAPVMVEVAGSGRVAVVRVETVPR